MGERTAGAAGNRLQAVEFLCAQAHLTDDREPGRTEHLVQVVSFGRVWVLGGSGAGLVRGTVRFAQV